MATTKIEVVQNDQLYNLNFTLKDANGVALSLAAIGDPTVVKFKVQRGTAVPLVADATMTILDEDLGTCYYAVASGVFTVKGNYKAEIEVTYGNGKIITFPDIAIRVKSELPIT